MQKYTEIIQAQIEQSIATKLAVSELLTPDIIRGGERIIACLQAGKKILCCGNGGSAADAQHFAAELVGRYVQDRVALPALALAGDPSTVTSIANDYGYDFVYSRQIEALGNPGDLLLAITTSGNSTNILHAVTTAHSKGLQIIALTGKGGGKLNSVLQPNDLHLCIPSSTTSRIQEAHILIIHCLCELIDHTYA